MEIIWRFSLLFLKTELCSLRKIILEWHADEMFAVCDEQHETFVLYSQEHRRQRKPDMIFMYYFLFTLL